jgi:hypothetical protein
VPSVLGFDQRAIKFKSTGGSSGKKNFLKTYQCEGQVQSRAIEYLREYRYLHAWCPQGTVRIDRQYIHYDLDMRLKLLNTSIYDTPTN